MKKTTGALLVLLPLAAAANPFPKGDPEIGKTLVEKSCTSCHVRLVGADGSDIYTRIDRKINTPQALLQRVATCNAQANARWLPDEEEHAAAYLNQQYYKFK